MADEPKKLSKKELNKLNRKLKKKQGTSAEVVGSLEPFEYQNMAGIVSRFLASSMVIKSGSGSNLTVSKLICRTEGRLYPLATPALTYEVDRVLDLLVQKDIDHLPLFDAWLNKQTFLINNQLSLADFGLHSFLAHFSPTPSKYPNLTRWLKLLPVLQSKSKSPQTSSKSKPKKASKQKGPTLPPLHDAEQGQVVTRFPPEPSGHLHIGHAKALFLNKYYAERYSGKLIFRFDDTNPSKEKEEYAGGILDDLTTLGFDCSQVTHTSDYFDRLKNDALTLISKGLAYMDDSSPDVMKQHRDEGVESAQRENSAERNTELFEQMYCGESTGWCLRAKIDMQSVNKCLRDPVLFRQNSEPHLRTGTKYKAYPTYDLACPIVDSIEGVTHALRDMNYKDRVPLYHWVTEGLSLRKVNLHDFSRMNFVNTIMSKRKLKWVVEQGLVDSWADPRFPTIKGILRRGLQKEALEQYMLSQGASRKIADIEWDKLWNTNKKVIDPVVPRYMGVTKDASSLLKLKLSNFSQVFNNTDSDVAGKWIPKHPKDTGGEKYGNKFLSISEELLLERGDFAESAVVGEEILLLQLGVVKILQVDEELVGEYIPNGNLGAAKRKVHWVSASENLLVAGKLFEYDHLLTKEVLGPEDDFKDFLNTQSKAETEVWLNQDLKLLQEGDCCQLLRLGYFRVDKAYDGENVHLVMIPDGKQTAMSTFSSNAAKMKHH